MTQVSEIFSENENPTERPKQRQRRRRIVGAGFSSRQRRRAENL